MDVFSAFVDSCCSLAIFFAITFSGGVIFTLVAVVKKVYCRQPKKNAMTLFKIKAAVRTAMGPTKLRLTAMTEVA